MFKAYQPNLSSVASAKEEAQPTFYISPSHLLRRAAALIMFQPVAPSSELEEGKGRPYELEGHRIALVRHKGVVYALDDLCPHADASIAFGSVENGCIACPWHYAEFSLETGEVQCGPSPRGIRTYQVREVDGTVEIQLQSPENSD